MRRRGCGAILIGLQGSRHKLWWSGNKEGYGEVGVLVKEELYDKVIEVRRVNDRAMSLAIVFESGEICMGICSTKWKIDGRKINFLSISIKGMDYSSHE